MGLQGWLELVDGPDAALTGFMLPSKSSYTEVAQKDTCGGRNTTLQVCPLADRSAKMPSWTSPNCDALDCVLAAARSQQLQTSCASLGVYAIDWIDPDR